jgi:hypothetical protein
LGERLSRLDKTVAITAVLEAFDHGIFSHGSGSAYPPDRSRAVLPSLFGCSWADASLDGTVAVALREVSNALHFAALRDGQDVANAPVYVNYALFDTPLENMYGTNLAKLRRIRIDIDPANVMDLAGGFKF